MQGAGKRPSGRMPYQDPAEGFLFAVPGGAGTWLQSGGKERVRRAEQIQTAAEGSAFSAVHNEGAFPLSENERSGTAQSTYDNSGQRLRTAR